MHNSGSNDWFHCALQCPAIPRMFPKTRVTWEVWKRGRIVNDLTHVYITSVSKTKYSCIDMRLHSFRSLNSFFA